jgi:peptide/nickel transport system substrate-binding protein
MLANPRRSCAILVGTHHYRHLEDLPAVGAGVDRLRQLLTDSSIWGLPEDRCVLLQQPASAADVGNAIEDAVASVSDTLIFYYSGHGLTAPRTMELGLALVESRANAPHTVLPFEWIRQAVVSSRAARKVVILDCCYGARAFAGGMAGPADLASDAEIEGSYLLAAAAETKKALAPPGERYTAFTGELISVLDNGIPGGPEFLDMDSIYETVHATLAGKSRPLPQQRNRNTAARIAFARNKAHGPTAGGATGQRPELCSAWRAP